MAAKLIDCKASKGKCITSSRHHIPLIMNFIVPSSENAILLLISMWLLANESKQLIPTVQYIGDSSVSAQVFLSLSI